MYFAFFAGLVLVVVGWFLVQIFPMPKVSGPLYKFIPTMMILLGMVTAIVAVGVIAWRLS